ncbi:hypothetical protein MGU_03130 [Metarhizium guizhouense ARSEF 977]|uniref:Uncharacterized protein n=1 Tax=Metarhizium guizhouense (strain ARSEF 977) TaxID=1276136 RepID=A0A0B4GQY9_METGA|nr:hypothetical protein MGU_03130 [Metarhizium guizhouense ARSEF 977]
MYQSTAISSYFTTQGYLIPIISVLAVAILPRDKFTQSLILNVLFICIASAMSLLAVWSSVQARIHTSSPSSAQGPVSMPLPYNSSQSAVCAVWLFANIWFANLIRAKMPSFNLPVIIYSILVNTSLTAGPTIGTTMGATHFVRELLLANLFGMGLAAGVCFFIFPFSSRMIVMGEFRQLIGLLRKMVRLQGEHLAALARREERTTDTISNHGGKQDVPRERKNSQSKKKVTARGKANRGVATTATCLSETVVEIRRLAGKLYGDMVFAKRDTAWGKLNATDLADIFTLMYNITIPLVAISTSIRMLKGDDKPNGQSEERSAETQVQNQIAEKIHTSFQLLAEPIDQGLEHAGICLEILPKSKKSQKMTQSGNSHGNVDIEGHGGQIYPGDKRFGVVVNTKIGDIYTQIGSSLRTWLCERLSMAEDDALANNQPQLSASLYLEQLMLAAGEAIQGLVVFADKKVGDGTMSHKQLILPSRHRLWRWLKSIVRKRGSVSTQNSDVLETNDDYYGDGYWEKKNPERLPPAGTWQHIGVGLCKISNVLGSRESAFGFRVACAAMSVSILAFLEKTQSFFQEQRLLWAMLTITLGMTITSGQSIFGFFCRVGGTFLAMVSSLAIWYIPDQKTPGIIVFLWLFIFVEYYFIKFPRLAAPVIITVTTQLVIVGYELQVRTLGEAVATRSGQPYYPIYLLGPYRLAVIAGGSLVAFFWTFFPCALTDRTWLRRDFSAVIYLLGNYFSVLSSTMEAQLEEGAGIGDSETAAARRLVEVRRKIFGKVMRLNSSIESHIMWQRWEPSIGGSFPTEAYEEMFERNTRITGYLMLMSYALASAPLTEQTYTDNDSTEQQAAGASDAEAEAACKPGRQPNVKVLQQIELTHHMVLSTLTMLSNALLSGQRLPPFIPMPRHYGPAKNRMLQSEIGAKGASRGGGNSMRSHLHSDKHGNLALRIIDLRERHDRTTKRYIRSDRRSRRGEVGGARGGSFGGSKVNDPMTTGLRVYLLTQVCGALVCDELEALARVVGRLVGIVDFGSSVTSGNGHVDLEDDTENLAVEKPISEHSAAASAT